MPSSEDLRKSQGGRRHNEKMTPSEGNGDFFGSGGDDDDDDDDNDNTDGPRALFSLHGNSSYVKKSPRPNDVEFQVMELIGKVSEKKSCSMMVGASGVIFREEHLEEKERKEQSRREKTSLKWMDVLFCKKIGERGVGIIVRQEREDQGRDQRSKYGTEKDDNATKGAVGSVPKKPGPARIVCRLFELASEEDSNRLLSLFCSHYKRLLKEKTLYLKDMDTSDRNTNESRTRAVRQESKEDGEDEDGERVEEKEIQRPSAADIRAKFLAVLDKRVEGVPGYEDHRYRGQHQKDFRERDDEGGDEENGEGENDGDDGVAEGQDGEGSSSQASNLPSTLTPSNGSKPAKLTSVFSRLIRSEEVRDASGEFAFTVNAMNMTEDELL